MKVKIPDSTKEISLADYQFIMSNLNTDVERGEYIMDKFSKVNVDKFDDSVKASVFNTTMKLFEVEISKGIKPEDEYKGYSIPSELLRIKVGHFIEIVNASPDLETLEGAEIVAACFYRKDWEKGYSEKELEEVATYFRSQPLYYALGGLKLMSDLFERLRDVFPLLHDEQVNEEAGIEKVEDDGRKMYDMLMGLTQNRFIDWDEAKNRNIGNAFVYLEELKKEQIKQRLNNKNR